MTNNQNNDPSPEKPAPPEEQSVTTQHVVTIGEQKISYTATAGTLVLHEESEEKGTEAKATIFYVAYTQDGTDLGSRPLTFSFDQLEQGLVLSSHHIPELRVVSLDDLIEKRLFRSMTLIRWAVWRPVLDRDLRHITLLSMESLVFS